MIVCPENDDVGFGGPTFVGRVPKEAVLEEVVTKEVAPEEAVLEEVVLEEVVPEEVVLEEVVLEEVVLEEVVRKPDVVEPEAVELEAVRLETAVFSTPRKISVLSTKRSPEESADTISPRIVTAAEPGKIVVLSRTISVGLMVNNSVEIVIVSSCRFLNLCALTFASRSKPTIS